MKYKVSLLPEKNRKRIIGKKKAVKAKSVALVILLVLLANVLILTICNTYAHSQLNEVVAMNDEYEQKVSALQQYRDINSNLQNKISLIKSIQVKEPALCNFMVQFGNIDHPGVSVTDVDCTDWKVSRVCVVTGSATSRNAFNKYFKTLESEFKSVTCTTYTNSVVDGKVVANFSITITCEGGSVPVTVAESTTQAAQ